jgi:hypothetical protein
VATDIRRYLVLYHPAACLREPGLAKFNRDALDRVLNAQPRGGP